MKKSLMYATIGLVALASCSEDGDEVKVVNQDGAISFRPILERATTKGSALTQSNLTDFTVDCWNKTISKKWFSGCLVSWTGSEWKTGGAYYWPNSETDTLVFYGWAPDQGLPDGTRTMNDEKVTWSGFTVKNKAADQKDVMYAKSKGIKKDKKDVGVHMDFVHMLSQVSFVGYNGNPNMDIKIVGMRINGLANSGTYTGVSDTTMCNSMKNAGVWSAVDTMSSDCRKNVFWAKYDDGISILDGGDTINLVNGAKWVKNGMNESMFLIPQKQGGCTIDDKNEEDENWWDKITADSASVSFLCSIRFMDEQAWPDSVSTSESNKDEGWSEFGKTRDEYGYAWATVDIPVDFEVGKKYVYYFNFGAGAGYSDPAPTELGDMDVSGYNINDRPELEVDEEGVIKQGENAVRIAGTGWPILREWDPIKFCHVHVYDWVTGQELTVEMPNGNDGNEE